MNFKIRLFEDSILNLINESDLSMEIKRLVVSDIFNLVVKQADKEVKEELSAQTEEKTDEQSA